MKHLFILLLCSFFAIGLRAQEMVIPETPAPKKKSRWLPANQSSIVLWNVNYRYKLNKSILNSGHGFGVELGINPGYFISQKLLLGAFVGYSSRDHLYQTQFQKNYMDDFRQGFKGSEMSGNDSILVNYMVKVMDEEKGYYHALTMYYGLMLKLPYQYAPVVKIYTGISNYAYHTLDEPIQMRLPSPRDQVSDKQYFDIERKMTWGIEVFLFNGYTKMLPYQFENAPEKKWKWSYQMLALSFYIEQYDAYRSVYTFSDGYYNIKVPMRSFMSDAFMNKHKKDYHIGLRLSLGAF